MIIQCKKIAFVLFLSFSLLGNIFGQIIQADSNATLIGRWEKLEYNTFKVNVSGNFAYVAMRNGGLRIVDVSSPTVPVEVDSFITGVSPDGHATHVQVVGNLAYVTAGFGNLHILDVSNPTDVIELGFLQNSFGLSSGLCVLGNYAYVTVGVGLKIIDISDSTSPYSIGFWDTNNSFTWNVDVVGNYAYVADGWDGLRILDVSDPTTPVEVGFYVTGGDHFDGFDVHVKDNYAYFADGANGFRIIDVSNPITPVEVGVYNTGDFTAVGVSVVGDYAYVANNSQGLSIFNITNPSSLELVGYYYPDPWAGAGGGCVSDNKIYLGSKGFYIIRNDLIVEIENENEMPSSFLLNQNYPNPFNPSTIIKYTIPTVSLVSLKIYDILGKEIETLVNEEKSIGSYEVEFDAARLPSGIYFYQLKAGNFVQTMKMVFLK